LSGPTMSLVLRVAGPVLAVAVALGWCGLLREEAIPGRDEPIGNYAARVLQRSGELAEEAYIQVLRIVPGLATVTVGSRHSKGSTNEASPLRDNPVAAADTLKQTLAKDEVGIDAQQKVSAKRYAEVLKEASVNDAPVLPETPDEVRLRMGKAEADGPEMRCGQSIPTRSVLVTRDVELEAVSEFQGARGAGTFAWKYKVTFRNRGQETVQMLTRHWVFVDAHGGLSAEVKGPGARGVTPVLPPGGEWTYESGTSLSTPIGSMYGSFNFEVLKTSRVGEPRSFSARVARLALSHDGLSQKVPCIPEASADLLPSTSVLAIERVIIGGNADFVRKKKKKYTFAYDVQINNARHDDVEVVGHRWVVVDSTGKQHVMAEGPGVGGVYQSRSRRLSAGDAFRTQGELVSPTPEANAEGTYRVLVAGDDGSKVEIEARTGFMGLSADKDLTHVKNFVVDPKFTR